MGSQRQTETWLPTDPHESGNAERRVRNAMISQKFDYKN
jgi:hypothetical protein